MRASPLALGSLIVLLASSGACTDELSAPDALAHDRCFGVNAEAALAERDDFEATWASVREAGASMDHDHLAACYPGAPTLPAVPYDALSADYLDVIETEIGIDEDQRELLAQNGFVALEHVRYDSFEDAYSNLYAADLPVLVTSDSLLYALHRSFDRILAEVEKSMLKAELELMLDEMHAELATLELPPELEPAARDLDIYLAVARSLLTWHMDPQPTVRSRSAGDQVEAILEAVQTRAPGWLELFGPAAPYDYSQLDPRGHYLEGLQSYFRAMMWLGRTHVPLITYTELGEPVLSRRGVEVTVLTKFLLDRAGRERWDRNEAVLHRLLGEPDSLNVATLDQLCADAGIDELDDLVAASDEQLRDTLLAGEYGVQRIMSQLIMTELDGPAARLPQVFALFGQRFVIDSYVMHAVSFDRLVDPQTDRKIPRMLPKDLDVAFALGSDVAGELLADELARYPYAGVLHDLRFLIDAHPEEFWRENFYNGWLHALRSLDDPLEQAEYPAAMRTRAWQLETLNTQLASWAELRHDTLLYAKASYSSSLGCEYPQAYVEPVPEFYARMGELAVQGLALADVLSTVGRPSPEIRAYFEHMAAVMTRLEDIATKELDGTPLDDDEWEFLRGTIEAEKIGCNDGLRYDGWYGKLLIDVEDHGDFQPTIVDVHTAPTDADGTPVGWVLHAATSSARPMIFTVEDCSGVRAYVGPISTYSSKLTENFERLDDLEWFEELADHPAQRPAWAEGFAR